MRIFHAEEAIEEKFKFHVPVEIRTNREIENTIRNNPFSSVPLVKDGTKELATFLSSKPAEVKISDIQKYVVAPEKLVVRGKEVCLYCPNGCGKSKLSNTFLENKLRVGAITRNWKSVHKLIELSIVVKWHITICFNGCSACDAELCVRRMPSMASRKKPLSDYV